MESSGGARREAIAGERVSLRVSLRRPGRVRRPDACAALILKLDVLGSYTLHSEAA